MVVLPNNVNVADVDNTVVHEVVGHKGLRALIGEERFEEFIDEVYDHASDSIRKVIDRMTDRMVSEEADRLRTRKAQAHEREGEDVNANYYTDMAEARIEAEQKREEYRREATEEYLADMAGRIGDEGFEKMSRDELTLWGKIKVRVQQFLDKFLRGLKIAKSIRLTDKDIAYILFKSWKNMRDGGVFAAAEDAVMRRRTGWDDEMLSESAKIEDANNRFNRELQRQIDGTLPANHVYQLGRPGKILISAGIADLPIELSSRRLEKKASEEYGSNHPFDLASVNNLPQAINSPFAVFDSRTRDGVKVILTELKEGNNNFVVAIEARKASGRLEADINSIRSLYPKDRPNGILKWIADGLMRYCDKDKMRGFLSTQWPNYIAGIEKPSMDDQQRTNLADVAELDSAAKVIEDFENPTFEEEYFVRFRDSRDYVAREPVLARAMYDERIKRGALALAVWINALKNI